MWAIRPVQDADSEQLIALIGACWSEFPGCILDVDLEEQWLRAPAAAYAAFGGAFWVADDEGMILGSSGFRPSLASLAEIKGVYVAASARRHGLATVLVKQAEQSALDAGYTGVQAWSDTRFTGAHNLYARLGYARTGRSRDLHDISHSTEIEFAKEL
ncbi:GNAT family N-acetyltransferase [Hoyosella subflava]|uniref:GCN5-like N-acetyltransferase n=1 Tax=Hoyosella subflava (strain DSM 45089 / JCM 17490 / NBRC 109087 / DQS3-9A1) TaxID=443218 RepID=F6ER79_HOYSD|nr:GNAT family N-acetyltransferase [Hoyosella subflava]AEF41957.1 GCN5-like N-acetyltransferase [Hoyosella subflava DQS3-9A1]